MNLRDRGLLSTLVVGLSLLIASARAQPPSADLDGDLAAARQLYAAGKYQEATELLVPLTETLGDEEDPARYISVLNVLAAMAQSLGDYEAALRWSDQTRAAAAAAGNILMEAEALQTRGIALSKLGEPDRAVEALKAAIEIHEERGDHAAQVRALSTLGGIQQLDEKYFDALGAYESALRVADDQAADGLSDARNLVRHNMASLLQRMGKFQRALDLYLEVEAGEPNWPAAFEGRMLANMGALYRHLGDPYKAVETYDDALRLYRTGDDVDGESGVLLNLGIAQALDLNRTDQALTTFEQALELAERSQDKVLALKCRLHLAEAYRLIDNLELAGALFLATADQTRMLELPEEQWKADFGLGRIAEATGAVDLARKAYERAIATIEQQRLTVVSQALNARYFVEKGDVYDSLLELDLAERRGAVSDPDSWSSLLAQIESMRSRALKDRLGIDSDQIRIETIQSNLSDDSAYVTWWRGRSSQVMLWATNADFGGLVEQRATELEPSVVALTRLLRTPGTGAWKNPARELGQELFHGIERILSSDIRHLVVTLDSRFHGVPIGMLLLDSRRPVGDRFSITRLPTATMLKLPPGERGDSSWPWSRQILGFAFPTELGDAATAVDPSGSAFELLPFAGDELMRVSTQLPGTAELLVDINARKARLTSSDGLPPIVHFATHAVANSVDSDQSRLLLAGADGSAAFLLASEIREMDLSAVQLVVLSACESERGGLLEGEGLESLGRVFLESGVSVAVTTLWRVADEPTAAFMEQFYHHLGRGLSVAEAVSQSQLAFVAAGGEWSQPYYWSGFVVVGDGSRVIVNTPPWFALAAFGTMICAFAALIRLRP